MQILADRAGTTIHLGERECSLQRRHQKVIEEAPSPLLDAATRARIGEAACEVARSVSYEGAGTVEFLVADAAPDEFFFIEMNTRLQVEHPVTELVTGVDLVEQQLRIAAGEPLALAQDDIVLTGHAIEARIYAESPSRGFLPATGTVLALHEPSGPGWRVDSGLVEGMVDRRRIRPDARQGDRRSAQTASEALAPSRRPARPSTSCSASTPTSTSCVSVLADPDVRAGRLDTGLLDRRGTPAAAEPDADDLAVARGAAGSLARPRATGPWTRDGWRAGQAAPRHPDPRVVERRGDAPVPRRATGSPWAVARTASVAVAAPRAAHARAPERRPAPSASPTMLAGLDARVRSRQPRAAHPDARNRRRRARDGRRHVEAGDTIVTVEAMKMENALTAPVAGIVRVDVRVGDLVTRDQVVAVIEEAAPEAEAPTKRKAPTEEGPV